VNALSLALLARDRRGLSILSWFSRHCEERTRRSNPGRHLSLDCFAHARNAGLRRFSASGGSH